MLGLETIDWTIIIGFFAVSLFISLLFVNKSSTNISEYFLSGRKLPWYIAGLSMVATTFAADTPLAVTELVSKYGVSGNWLWWNMLIGGMLTTFFFAKLWRRANIVTDAEFIELRYGGKPAAFLRGFKAIYIGLFMNTIIMGWVNKALISILCIFFDIPSDVVIWYVAGAMLFTAIYSSIGGMWAITITDSIQFIIAMAGCIVLAIIVLNAPEIGGMEGLQSKLPKESFDFFPKIGDANTNIKVFSISVLSFLGFIGIQWWASWYPGAEPGGGGYIAQRMMSAKDEKNSLWATLFFQIAHYAIRPWPWIITGLCSVILYPNIENTGSGYVMAMKDYLPAGLKGLLLVAFLAAYMSTISTQLNWGASYIINDFIKRFFYKENGDTPSGNKKLVLFSRIYTLIAMCIAVWATTLIDSISGVWAFIIESGAGLGLVLILRWYWWRINAWSEISATIAPFIGYGISRYVFGWQFPDTANGLFFTVGFTTITWLAITFLTKAEQNETLQKFYTQIQPLGIWGYLKDSRLAIENKTIPYLLGCWILSIIGTYGILFSVGSYLFNQITQASVYGLISILAIFGLYRFLKPAGLR